MANKQHKINNLFWFVVWLLTTFMVLSFFWSVTLLGVVMSILVYSVMELALWFTIHNAIDEIN